MAKASFTLPNGTSVVIEGTPEEVQGLLAFYTDIPKASSPQKSKIKESITETATGTASKTKADKTDIEKII